MPKIKTSALTGPALDWAVAICQSVEIDGSNKPIWFDADRPAAGRSTYSPSTDWSQGGPILDRYGICTRRHNSGTWYAVTHSDLGDSLRASWSELTVVGSERYSVESWAIRRRQQRFDGSTALIAAMRCYVASKLGAEVEVPEDFLK